MTWLALLPYDCLIMMAAEGLHSVLNRCRNNCCQTQHRPRLLIRSISPLRARAKDDVLISFFVGETPWIFQYILKKFVIAFRKLSPVLPGEASSSVHLGPSAPSAEILYAVIRSGFQPYTHGIFPVTQDISHAHAIHKLFNSDSTLMSAKLKGIFHPGPDRCCTGSHT